MKINIRRSKTDRIIGGVIGGLSEHYHWNATLARVLFILFSLNPIGSRNHYLLSSLDLNGRPRLVNHFAIFLSDR